MVKNQSWEKRRQTSKKIRETDLKTHTREGSDHNSTETIECLQDHLKREMDEHIRGHLLSQSKCFKEPTSEAVSVCVCVFSLLAEGRGAAENIQGRVGRIQQLVEALREERVKMEAATEKADICQQVTHEYYLPTGDQTRICAQNPITS